MKTLIIKITVLCTLAMSSQIYANSISSQQNMNAKPIEVVKDIHKLYSSLLMNDLTQSVKTNIICEQIPTKIKQYKNTVSQDKSQTMSVFINLQENIEQTRKTLQISCNKA